MSADYTGRRGPDLPELPERINQLWRALWGAPPVRASESGLWHPTVDIYDGPEEIVVEVELPGMKGQKIDVSVEEDHLYIEGTRERPQRRAENESYYLERPAGPFHRVIHLPSSVDGTATQAKYDDGLLVVTMPKVERARARRIEIK
jgi:HSP20 family protein